MFELGREEIQRISQIVISSAGRKDTLKFSKSVLVFVEQGVAMLSSILSSRRAVQANIAIMRTFVNLREMMTSHKDLARKLEELEKKYDGQLIQKIVERPFREAAFSRIVKEEYGSCCAMTGMSIKNDGGILEVEAAHIKPVRFNGPDSVRNGIALCRTLHWMFDHGLVSIADSGIIIAKKIIPNRIHQLLNSDGKVRLPANQMSAPHPEFMKFHREKIFISGTS